MMCPHIAIVLAKHKPHLLQRQNRHVFCRMFFHPAYLLENWRRAVDGLSWNRPQVNMGPDVASLDLTALDSDGEEIEDEAPEQGRQPMLPPLKYTMERYKLNQRHGRPRTRSSRSRGAAAVDGGPAAPGQDPGASTEDARARLANVDWLDEV